MNFALNNKDTQKRKSVITFSLYTPYKPKCDRNNQLNITVKKNSDPNIKKNGIDSSISTI
jgi:hypothetical protein